MTRLAFAEKEGRIETLERTMKTKVAVSRPVDVTNILSELLGRGIQTRQLSAKTPPGAFFCVATYAREDGSRGALCAMDLPLSASLAAALMLVPRAVVDECVRAKRLDEMLEECLHEVCNVSGRYFNGPRSPRVRMDFRGHAPFESDVAAFFASPATRSDLDVSVTGYLGGKLTLLAD